MSPQLIEAIAAGLDLLFDRLERSGETLTEAEIEARNEIRRQVVEAANNLPDPDPTD